MNRLLMRTLVCAGLVAALTAPAGAAVLTFDDLNTGGAGAVSTSYAGYIFNNWWHIDSPPYSYPNASAPTVIYNSESSYTNTPEIVFGTAVDVDSLYLADYNSGSVTLRGYSGATEIYTDVIALTSSMVQYAINFDGIDRFVMETTPGSTFAFLDNLEVNASSVPEPATLALASLGLASLGVTRRRR